MDIHDEIKLSQLRLIERIKLTNLNLERSSALSAAMSDSMSRGTGVIFVTASCEVEHIPFDEVKPPSTPDDR